ncbi:MAG: hypothetical protein GY856_25830, partial [bacterium]|nr:hypothetical protein [bacterium]
WPDPPEGPAVPMLSRWRMQEQHTGIEGLPQIQYAFLELSKYSGDPHPKSMLDKWAYFYFTAPTSSPPSPPPLGGVDCWF